MARRLDGVGMDKTSLEEAQKRAEEAMKALLAAEEEASENKNLRRKRKRRRERKIKRK